MKLKIGQPKCSLKCHPSSRQRGVKKTDDISDWHLNVIFGLIIDYYASIDRTWVKVYFCPSYVIM